MMPTANNPTVLTHGRRRTLAGSAHGAVLLELLLALPILFVLLSLLFYFGRGFVRVQHAVGMDRYEAWRRAEEAPGPGAEADGDNSAMNSVFFSSNASTIEFEAGNDFPTDARDTLIRAAESISPEAAGYADELFAQLPAGSVAAFSTTHAEPNDFWRHMAGAIHHRHTRIGNDWRFVNGIVEQEAEDGGTRWIPANPKVSNIPVIREVFFRELDDVLRPEADRGIKLAETLRGFYLHQPGYAGPEVPTEWNWEQR